MKKLLKILFFILLTGFIINNTYKTNQISEIYFDNMVIRMVNNNSDIVKKLEKTVSNNKNKIESLDYRPVNLISSSVTIHNARGRGSGSIIKVEKNSTYILTATHVLYEEKIIRNISGKLEKINILSTNITVKTNEKNYKAVLVKMDKKLDIAVIRIFKRLNVEPVKIAKKEPEFGETVWAITSPGGHRNVLNRGVFSAVDKEYSFVSTAGYFGSSGGMVVNTKGEQIGVVSTIWLTEVNGFFPNITTFNGITRTKDLNKFLKGIL